MSKTSTPCSVASKVLLTPSTVRSDSHLLSLMSPQKPLKLSMSAPATPLPHQSGIVTPHQSGVTFNDWGTWVIEGDLAAAGSTESGNSKSSGNREESKTLRENSAYPMSAPLTPSSRIWSRIHSHLETPSVWGTPGDLRSETLGVKQVQSPSKALLEQEEARLRKARETSSSSSSSTWIMRETHATSSTTHSTPSSDRKVVQSAPGTPVAATPANMQHRAIGTPSVWGSPEDQKGRPATVVPAAVLMSWPTVTWQQGPPFLPATHATTMFKSDDYSDGLWGTGSGQPPLWANPPADSQRDGHPESCAAAAAAVAAAVTRREE